SQTRPPIRLDFMSRIPPSPARGLFARVIFWFSRRMLGKVPSSLKVTAHHPALLAGVAHMERAQSKASALPAQLRSLVSLRVATRVGCPF
ncbi:MAG: hypothetical protein AAGC55_34010, partial [Myxococcota bacterium]